MMIYKNTVLQIYLIAFTLLIASSAAYAQMPTVDEVPPAAGIEAITEMAPVAPSTDILPEAKADAAVQSDTEVTSASQDVLVYDYDPCPQAQAAINEKRDDLDLIQEDITRFSLCVQRAQLLERLNTLAQENADTIETTILNNVEASMPQAAVMPNYYNASAPALPTQAMVQNSDSGSVEPYTQNSPEFDTWKIVDIMGQDGTLMAKLSGSDGKHVIAHEGDVLADEQVVQRIEPTKVTLKSKNNVHSLEWGE